MRTAKLAVRQCSRQTRQGPVRNKPASRVVSVVVLLSLLHVTLFPCNLHLSLPFHAQHSGPLHAFCPVSAPARIDVTTETRCKVKSGSSAGRPNKGTGLPATEAASTPAPWAGTCSCTLHPSRCDSDPSACANAGAADCTSPALPPPRPAWSLLPHLAGVYTRLQPCTQPGCRAGAGRTAAAPRLPPAAPPRAPAACTRRPGSLLLSSAAPACKLGRRRRRCCRQCGRELLQGEPLSRWPRWGAPP